MENKRLAWKGRLMYVPRAMQDAWTNWRHVRGAPRLLIVRHAAKNWYVFRDYLAWLQREFPEVRARFEFRLLPFRPADWSRYALHALWAGDTIAQWSPRGFNQAKELLDQCDQFGVPVINRVDQLANAAKALGAKLIRSTGIRTPQMVRIHNPQRFCRDFAGLAFPLLIREDRGHGQPTAFVASPDELRKLDLERYREPIACEFIDVRDPRDGLYRKYRYLAAGEMGLPKHLIINDHWEVRPQRRVQTDATRREELAFLHEPDPNHALLQRARRALGLDVIGFDYSYDAQGRVVVWEANPYPDLNYPKNPWSRHIHFAVEKTFAAVTCLYLQRAGLAIPGRLEERLHGVSGLHDIRSSRRAA